MDSLDSRVGAGEFPRSHALIVVSKDEALRERKLLELAKAAVCHEGTACGVCRQCVLADRGIHPDISFIDRAVDDKGKMKREIAVAQIRRVVSDACVLPQEARRKVYVIRESNRMNVQAQNAALKILEEPPDFVSFLLGTGSPRELLATVRSRCELLFLGGEGEFDDDELALEFLRLSAAGDLPGLCGFCVRCESLDSQRISDMLSGARVVLSRHVAGHNSAVEISRRDAVRLLALVSRGEEYLKLNVSVKHVLGMLCVEAIGG